MVTKKKKITKASGTKKKKNRRFHPVRIVKILNEYAAARYGKKMGVLAKYKIRHSHIYAWNHAGGKLVHAPTRGKVDGFYSPDQI